MNPLFNVIKTTRTAGDIPTPEAGARWALVSVLLGNAAPVLVWALVEDKAQESASGPTDADIQRRIALLTKAATLDAHPDRISGVDSHYATFDGRFLLTEWTEGGCSLPEWKDVDEATFRREIERVATRQLLAERGGK